LHAGQRNAVDDGRDGLGLQQGQRPALAVAIEKLDLLRGAAADAADPLATLM
jgi:hypothetical protein